MDAATFFPSRFLHQLQQRWQSLAARKTPPKDFAGDAVAFFRKRALVTALLGATLSAAFGAFCMYKFLAGDLSALRAQYQAVGAEISGFRSDLNAVDARQRSDLQDHVIQEKASRQATTSSLLALNVHAAVLAARLEQRALKPQEVRDVLGSIREISTVAASKFDSIVTNGGVIPDDYAPMLAFAGTEAESRDAAGFFSGASPSAQPAYLGKLLLTRGAVWHAGDRHILFKWEGGSARLRARPEVSQRDIVRMTELFNSVSLAVGQAILGVPRPDAPRAAVFARSSAGSRTAVAHRTPVMSPPRADRAAVAPPRQNAPKRIDVVQRAEITRRLTPAPAP